MRVHTTLPVHFMPGKAKASCGHDAYEAGGSTLGSRDVRDVTCSKCMGTDEYMGGALAQRRAWQAEDTSPADGFTVPEKLAIGGVQSAMAEVIGGLELYLDALTQLDQDIDDLEYALTVLPWWQVRLRRPIKTKLKRLRTERGY